MSTYPAKLLLFGEYTIIKGSEALAMPFPALGGHWAFSKKEQDAQVLQQRLPRTLAIFTGIGREGRSLDCFRSTRFSAGLIARVVFRILYSRVATEREAPAHSAPRSTIATSSNRSRPNSLNYAPNSLKSKVFSTVPARVQILSSLISAPLSTSKPKAN